MELRLSPISAPPSWEAFQSLIRQHPLGSKVSQFRAGVQVEFLPNPLAVGLHGLDAQVQAFSDVGGLHAVANQVKNLQLAIGQQIERRACPFLRLPPTARCSIFSAMASLK